MMSDYAEAKHEIIERKAYELFEARGGEDGHDLDDWLQAEAMVIVDASQESPVDSEGREAGVQSQPAMTASP
jgi:hypothetical protein